MCTSYMCVYVCHVWVVCVCGVCMWVMHVRSVEIHLLLCMCGTHEHISIYGMQAHTHKGQRSKSGTSATPYSWSGVTYWLDFPYVGAQNLICGFHNCQEASPSLLLLTWFYIHFVIPLYFPYNISVFNFNTKDHPGDLVSTKWTMYWLSWARQLHWRTAIKLNMPLKKLTPDIELNDSTKIHYADFAFSLYFV